MFKPLSMQRVSLHVLKEDAPAAALALAEVGVFNPEETRVLEKELPELTGKRYQKLYKAAQGRRDKILAHLQEASDRFPPPELRVVEEAELARVNEWLGEVWRQCSTCEERQRHIEEEEKAIEQLTTALRNFQALDIDLSLLQGDSRFLDIHVGTVPMANVQRLSEAVGLAGYMLSVYLEIGDTAHVIVAGLPPAVIGAEKEINTVLEAAGCRPLALPPEFKDHPQRLEEELKARRQRVAQWRRELGTEMHRRHDEHKEGLTQAVQTLALAAPYADLAEVLRSRGGLTMISGWVPTVEIPSLQRSLEARLAHPFVFDARDPRPEERPHVPSVTRHPPLLRPFLTLVKTYGVPRYGEFDPTYLFAITFVAMFGMMFGDVGHGAVIAGAGVLMRRKLRSFTPFVVLIGLSSVFFGFLYGSIFGYEEVIHPLWMSPLHDPILMLKLALYWGIGFILIAIGLTIRNRLAEGKVLEAMLDSKGVAGVLFYLGLLFAGYRYMAQGQFGWTEGLAMLVPLLVVLGYKWHEAEFPPGEKVLVVFIEGFDTLVAYVSNTLSFLRVAAFSLNHVALAIAIFTLANMMGTTGHWITVVLGNVFILVLEGGIVAIQVLRLEYYEGFSRFFSGDGREFRPLTLRQS